MKKRNFIYGAIILTLSALLSKILGAVYRIPLTNLLGTQGMGIYQMIFPVYMVLLVISSSGIPVAISRLVSEQVAKGNKKQAVKILKSALILTSIIGVACGLIVFFSANFIASLQGNSLASIGYLAVAPAIALGSIVSAFRGYFEGLQDMRPTAFSEVIEQIAKVALGLVFATYLLPLGIEYGALGAILGITVGEIASLLTIMVIYFFANKEYYKKDNIKVKQNQPQNAGDKEQTYLSINTDEKNSIHKKETLNLENSSMLKIAKVIFFRSVPITLSASIIPITLFIDSILIINLLANSGFNIGDSTSLFGIQTGIVNSLISLPIIISISLSTAILPTLSAARTIKNRKEINFKTSLAIKIVWLIALPCFAGFLLLGTDITRFLYSNGLETGRVNELEIAGNLIQIVAICVVYNSFTRIFLATLHALHKSYLAVRNLIISSMFKIILTIILVSVNLFNIYGASIASAFSYAVASLLCLMSVKKYVTFKFNIKYFLINPLLAILGLSASIILLKNILNNFLSANVTTIITIAVSGLVYFFILTYLKVFNSDELSYIPILKKIRTKIFKK